ncbi:MAG: radical SAM protein [Thermodesulfobacteriota bacterium]
MESYAAICPFNHNVEGSALPGPFPRRITIELSAACNLSCVMCPRRHAGLHGGFMERALFERVVEELGDHELEGVVPFFRGEPLLHPEFLEMITRLRQCTPAPIQLATNALLLTAELGKALLELGIDFISFSLDAIHRDTYERIRLGSDFDRVMENVHAFLRMRDLSTHSRTVVQVSATEGPENERELPDFIRYWKPRVDRVRIYPRHSDGGRYGSLSHPAHRRPAAGRVPCRKPFTDFVICADGHAALCNHDWDKNGTNPLGSVMRQSLEEIWKGKSYGEVRLRHLAREWNALNPCGQCDHWQGDGSGESIIGLLIES